jgi:signal transduction histidine kinase/DNA-binding response OmpR family regulator
MSFDEDAEGTIWIGTFSSGLYSFNPKTNAFTHHITAEFNKHSIGTKNIRKVLVDMSDNIWLGTRSGLFKIRKFDTNSYRVSNENDIINLSGNQPDKASIIASIFEDISGDLWIGTFGNGLCRYDVSNDSVNWFNLNNGLVHETVYSIVQDNSGDLWIGGNEGLTKLSNNHRTFTNFNKKDGLLSNNFNFNSVLKSSENVLYFGNSKGINFFDPDEIVYNQIKPRVYLTDLRISNDLVTPNSKDSPLKKVISRSNELKLNYKQSFFTINYVGINYTRCENNEYAYYLEGYEDDWNYVGSSQSATYKNIPKGHYIFRVKASNNDGIWNETPTILEIEIRPAWWFTNLAIVFYVLLLLIISYSIFKFVSIRIEERRILNFERLEHKQFEALNAKKIQFFTNISHEFRTPLTLILSPLEDILEKSGNKFSKEVKEKHKIIYKNAKRLARLINELMDFRKLQFNKMSINASQIELVPFIKEVASHFEEEALLKNIALNVSYEEDDITIWSDPAMLEKIVFNFLSNAFKATPELGEVTIKINRPDELKVLPLVDEEKPVPAIEVIFKDTGQGIKEENIEKIFDRFYQVEEMDGQYYGGTGIGLELVKSLINLHKGKIEITSKENEGTEFKIFIPLGYSHLTDSIIERNGKIDKNIHSETKKDAPGEEDLIDPNSEVKKIVLIVEDNSELRAYLKNELKNEYAIKEAENGQEGLEKAIKYIPDIIITDVMMPVMDGFELCSRIKNDLKTSHIPLLMVTAKGMQIDKVKGIDSGADVYLNKPFNMKILRSHLNQLITSRQMLFDKYFNTVNTSIDSGNTTSLDKQFITDVINYIQENIGDEKLNVEHLAGELFLSRSKLYRKIKALTGDTATEFIKKIRLEKAHQLIENSQLTISEICFKVGFSSPSYFTKCFKNYFGLIPTELKRKGASSKIS